MKRKMSNLIIGVLFLAGLSLLLYPMIANKWNTHRQEKLITTYEKTLSDMEDANAVDYDKEWKAAERYNRSLAPIVLPDSFSEADLREPSKEYLSVLNLTGNGMMGSIEIPSIKIKLPIFHTTEEKVLQIGAGHLEGSTLPIGGKGTHAVISAHRGLPSASLFTDLDKVKKGQHFVIHVLDRKLCYEVNQIKVVKPSETDALSIQKGKDYVTLITCTPYGVNSHRLLVRGHRVPYKKSQVDDEKPIGPISLHTNYKLWVINGLLITAIFIILLYLYESKRREKRGAQARNATKKGTKAMREDQKKGQRSHIRRAFRRKKGGRRK